MKSETIKKWWPLGQSLDLVRSRTDTLAEAVRNEVQRFVDPEPISLARITLKSLDSVFGSVAVFTNVPTIFFALPTRSEWTVLWNNSFLCNGYDSLCKCLTVNYGLDTVHWISHDEDTNSQAGTTFTFRGQIEGVLNERSVYVGKNDGKWSFYACGTPLPEEDLSWYEVSTKRERLPVGKTIQKRGGTRQFTALLSNVIFTVIFTVRL